MSTGCLFSHDYLSTKLRGRIGVLLAPHSYFQTLMLLPSPKAAMTESRSRVYHIYSFLLLSFANLKVTLNHSLKSLAASLSPILTYSCHVLDNVNILTDILPAPCSLSPFASSRPLVLPLLCLSLPEPDSRIHH